MTSAELLVSLIKILIVLLFLLNMAAVATWADRRQSAMIQDRVGPNRAVVTLPSNAMRIIVLLLPSALGVYAGYAGISRFFPDFFNTKPFIAVRAFEILGLASQVSVLVGWVTILMLTAIVRKNGALNSFEESLEEFDPRSVFFVGLGLHAIAFGVTRLVPLDAISSAANVACVTLGLVLFASGVYSASRVPDGGVQVRLAGTLHSLADAIKLMFKEDFVPKNGDKLLHGLAPILAMFAPLVTFAVIPFGNRVCFADLNGNRALDWNELTQLSPGMSGHDFICKGNATSLQIADLNVGILYLFAMAGTGVVGAAIAGWSSDNKFSLLGGLRAASQMVSYEVAMGLSLVGLFLIYGSVRLGPMVEWQGENAWGIFVQPFAFFLFLAALCAETKRVPFDQPEGESEIVAGYFVEYSGFKFGMFYTGEYVELITSSALLVTLFFGGYQLPFVHRDGITIAFGDATLFVYKMNHLALTLLSVAVFFGKTILMTWLQIFFRWTLPRFRYDQLMKLGWTKLLPLAIANMLVTAVLVLAADTAPAGLKSALKTAADVTQAVVAVGTIAAVVALVAGLLEPVHRTKFLNSTAARFASKLGGTKASPQQA